MEMRASVCHRTATAVQGWMKRRVSARHRTATAAQGWMERRASVHHHAATAAQGWMERRASGHPARVCGAMWLCNAEEHHRLRCTVTGRKMRFCTGPLRFCERCGSAGRELVYVTVPTCLFFTQVLHWASTMLREVRCCWSWLLCLFV